MNEQVSVETPEQIDIEFQQAGIGSRFYAALIDTAVLTLISLVGYYVNRRFISELGDIVGNWLGALGGVIVFALFWGYYMVFEVTTNGQTLGKRVLGLRVIKEGAIRSVLLMLRSVIWCESSIFFLSFMPRVYCVW